MITSFQGEFAFLSNFAAVDVNYDGMTYDTVEAAYQAAKTTDIMARQRIRLAETPNQAKKLGRAVTLRTDWESIKVAVMTELLWDKFTQEPFRSLLLSTQDETLIEGNTWNDRFWGATEYSGMWLGNNMLGKLLMQTRHLLQAKDNVLAKESDAR